MTNYNISKRFTFFGLLPPCSDKDHLAITLNEKDGLVKYCYCTSAFKRSLSRYNKRDFFFIKADDMTDYFHKSPKDTYIYFSEDKIIDITLNILLIKLQNNEYEARKPFNEIMFSRLIEAIKLSDNFSERFKKELFVFID